MDTLRPSRTETFSNYPNPFNPETWIPFQLERAAYVRITIYDVLGSAIRTFDLGYLSAGYYITRERAVYWDGRNDMNERVAQWNVLLPSGSGGFYRYTPDGGLEMTQVMRLRYICRPGEANGGTIRNA